MSIVVEGVDVGFFETSESNAKFYDYDPNATHQATGLTTDNVITQPNTRTAYVFFHHSTTDDTWAMFIHHFKDADENTGQAEVVWEGFGDGVKRSGFVFVTGDGIDRTAHGDTNYVEAAGTPVRNVGGGSYVFETGTTLTPFSAYTVAQDEETDLDGSLKSQDRYELNSSGDPVTQHYFSWNRGDGGGYAMNPGAFDVTMNMRFLTDGRDDGSPLPTEWVGVGDLNSVSKAAGDGTTLSVSIDV